MRRNCAVSRLTAREGVAGAAIADALVAETAMHSIDMSDVIVNFICSQMKVTIEPYLLGRGATLFHVRYASWLQRGSARRALPSFFPASPTNPRVRRAADGNWQERRCHRSGRRYPEPVAARAPYLLQLHG